MDRSKQKLQSDLHEWIAELNEFKDRGFALADRVGALQMNICPAVIETEPKLGVSLNGCDAQLTGTTQTFSWVDNEFSANTFYDFWIGSTPLDNDIYDHSGGNVFNGTSVTVSGLPTDGSTLYKTLIVTRDGTFSDKFNVECECTAADIENSALVQIDLDNHPKIAQGDWTTNDWLSLVGLGHRYPPSNMDHLSLIEEDGKCKIRQRHEASSKGSDRVISAFNLSALCYHMAFTQTIEVEDNFTWGTNSFSGKLGFGIGGGINTTGGDLNPEGFTVRVSWDANGEVAIYSYAASDVGNNLNFGLEIPTGFFITPGAPFTVRVEVEVNSDPSIQDGTLKAWINGNLVFDRQGIAYMTEGEPSINAYTYSQFHGGADFNWSPTETTYAKVCDISFECLDV